MSEEIQLELEDATVSVDEALEMFDRAMAELLRAKVTLDDESDGDGFEITGDIK